MTSPAQINTPAMKTPEGEYERFLYAVSHDLQEPLRMVTSFVKLLDNRIGADLDEEGRQYLDLAIENADRMKKMIYALVELSRVGRSTEPFEPIVMNDFVSDVIRMYSSDMKASGATIIRKQLPDCEAAPRQLMQLFRIIIQNAFENAAPDRSLEIEISGEEDENGSLYHIRDNGSGIRDVYLDKVTELFHTVDRSSDRIGSGLAIAKAITQRHGGNLWVSSVENQGTVITFRLMPEEQ